ncbi:hypothetical protein K438DRAFT_2083441 [Mycena galopus ATCC 62051]|nr:hypothetical protein K438DRAFT_2083441 [Mycena galopus ATCC 62051]
MPESLSLFPNQSTPIAPRVLHREWKTLKPYLPKSTSLPAFQLFPRDRPRYNCCTCGFVNFYCIPLCVWCENVSEPATRAFQRTMPRARTASAPPRVFWSPSELSLRPSHTTRMTADTASTQLHGVERRRGHNRTPPPTSFISIRDTHNSVALPLYAPIVSTSSRSQTHKRSHSQPNALRIGHSSRPYYSVIRKDTSFYTSSDARSSVASSSPRPASLDLLSPTSPETCPVLIDDDYEDDGPTFEFVNPAAARPSDPEARSPKRTLSARINRGLSSPVSALHTMYRAAEMREELATLVRQSGVVQDDMDDNVVTARLRKFQRDLKGLVRRATTHRPKLSLR